MEGSRIKPEIEEWNCYWQSKSLKNRIIEWFRKRYFAKKFAGVVSSFVKRGKILEAGCGSGEILKCVDRNLTQIGADYSFSALKMARKNGIVLLVVCDIKHLPFKSGSFEMVYNQGVMEHFSQKEFVNILREFKRVSKKILIIVPAKTSIFRMLYNPWKEMNPHFFSKDELLMLIKKEFPYAKTKYLISSFFLSVAGYGEW
jgi:ubiquinone/menaquinone biosynthesis C-methylase UbiE